NVVFGNYTLVVRDDYTQCISSTYGDVIADETRSDIEFSFGNLPTECADSDGELLFRANREDGTPTTFDFTVYFGGPVNTTTPIEFPGNPPVFDTNLNDGLTPQPNLTFPQVRTGIASNTDGMVAGLASNIYTIVATDGFGCQNYETYVLPYVDSHEVDGLVKDSEICPYTIGDGEISAAA